MGLKIIRIFGRAGREIKDQEGEGNKSKTAQFHTPLEFFFGPLEYQLTCLLLCTRKKFFHQIEQAVSLKFDHYCPLKAISQTLAKIAP